MHLELGQRRPAEARGQGAIGGVAAVSISQRWRASMRVNKQLLGGLVLVCLLVALAGAALWLRAPAKRLLGSKLTDLLDPGAEQRLSLIGQRESAVRSREVWDKPTLVMFGFTRCGKPCSETLDIISRTIV